MRSRTYLPVLASALGLAGALATASLLYHAADTALESASKARLSGAGESIMGLVAPRALTSPSLLTLAEANALEDAYLLDPEWKVVSAARGAPTGGRVNLLRVDATRLERAFAGKSSVGPAYGVGTALVFTGYFALRSPSGEVTHVLALEAGQAFVGASHRRLERAMAGAFGLAVLSALALAMVAAGMARAERQREASVARVARSEALARIAASAAHEVRNPLAVIRGTVELMQGRSAARLSPRDQADLGDILTEVERLRRLTEDLLDLSADRPLSLARLELAPLLEDAARRTECAFPEILVRCELAAGLTVNADAGRLSQVILNLLANAAQAQREGAVSLQASQVDAHAIITLRDSGPGVPAAVQARLFDPLVTSKAQGTGLGLAISRRLVERLGGTLRWVPTQTPGATFELRLPLESGVT